jgi:hypothetical protein
MILHNKNRILKRLPASFYRSDSGREPVREWLKGLEQEDRKAIGEDIKEVECSWPVGMPLVRSLGRECGKSGADCRVAALRGSFSASNTGGWCCCTASSRSLKRHSDTTSTWHLNGEQE